MLRQSVKVILRQVGLLEAVRRGRDGLDDLRCLPVNLTNWYRGAPDGLPVPPVRLIRLATGTPSVAWYLKGGKAGAECIRGLLDIHDISI